MGHDDFVELQRNDEIVITAYLEEFQRGKRILFKSGEYDSFRMLLRLNGAACWTWNTITCCEVCFDRFDRCILRCNGDIVRYSSYFARLIREHYKCMSEPCVLETEMKSKSWLHINKLYFHENFFFQYIS